ncbi:DUF3168 domain-containing protein [Pseudooceanicola sediminis]|uniref:DUF3168 domain-containing protein n=1 Tax=Pseudooceanicola sediminis TaxID=2211117 RepID=A0A399J6Z9_9RHOB|nr:DUF3168 domain-containing protein [Pseudooceanicola sediminis]KAA2317411.1 DUF3168 domain-containing protein [Puniceibacterium sp. HSS470]RII39762.1 DUF3168 domain-containing protein [Pseudooceanicola sediminis]|tara:strand:- start:10637 stop:11047 length:411 start_codon:yes stop_codon:yes gene_type:complete
MSYAVSAALQAAIFQQLSSDAALVALVGANIFDAPPTGTPPATYVSLGEERVSDRSDMTGAGALHDLTVSVITEEDGFQVAKSVAAVISDSLAQPLPALTRGVVVSLNFLKARARRDGNGTLRRIDMKFRARVQDI